MELSDFLIRVVFIGLPGIIGEQIYQKLKSKSVRKDWEDIIEIVLFALGSYAVYGLIVEVLRRCCIWNLNPPLRALFDSGIKISWLEIAGASFIGIILAFIAAYAYNRKWWNRLGQKLHVTKKFGDEDVWSFFLDLPETAKWVFVRDYKQDLVYYGWIKAFSESEKRRELVLMEVQVFSNFASDSVPKALYEAEAVYISRESDEMSIEIPRATQGETK